MSQPTRELQGLHPAVVATCALFLTLVLLITCRAEFAYAQGNECPNAAVREAQRSQYLPDCRAYEKVSPDDKNGYDITGLALGGDHQASSLGDYVAYTANGAFGDAQGAGVMTVVISRRSTTGWTTTSVSPRQELSKALPAKTAFVGPFSSDLSTTLIRTDAELTPDSRPGFWNNIYVRNTLTKDDQLVTTPTPPGFPMFEPIDPTCCVQIVGASSDFSHVTFMSPHNLPTTEGIVSTGSRLKLYEWVAGEPATLRLVNQSGTGAAAAGSIGSTLSGFGTKGLANGLGQTLHAISDDGARIFFTTPPGSGNAPANGEIYMREEGGASTQIDASERSTPDPPSGNTFWAASSDGSHALFQAGGARLTDDADGGNGLYLYAHSKDPGSDSNLTLLSRDSEPADGLSNGVFGVIGVSDALDRVYFYAQGDLIADQPPTGEDLGLYVWTDGELRFIAVAGSVTDAVATDSGSAFDLADRTQSGVTPDGRFAAFASAAPLKACGDLDSPSICPMNGTEQVFLYDAEADLLRCASCLPDGSAQTGSSALDEMGLGGGSEVAWRQSPSNLTAGGDLLFFNSRQAIDPRDTNGRIDAYVWENGEARVLSTGRGASDSNFVTANPDGSAAYFVTRERLVGSDRDHNADLYVARVDGGFLEGAEAAACEGDACQGPSTSSPAWRTPGSSALDNPPRKLAADCSSLHAKAFKKARHAKKAMRKAKKAMRKAKKAMSRAKKADGRKAAWLNERASKKAMRAKRVRVKAKVARKRATRAAKRSKECNRKGTS